MKYLIIFSLLLSIGFCVIPDYKTDFSKLKDRLDTPEKVQSYLTRYVRYNYDTKRKPYSEAYLTYLRGYAGCTDIAQFEYEVLTQHGYECQIYEVWNNTRGHSICIVSNEDGTYTQLSVYRPRKFKFSTIEGIVFQQYGDAVGYKKVK